MRPKKVIVLIDPNEERREVTRFVLLTHAYAVFDAAAPGGPEKSLATVDLVLVYDPPDPAWCAAIKAVLPHVPLVVVTEGPWAQFYGSGADAAVGAAISRAELLDRIKTMAARKRGPKKTVAPMVLAPA